MKRFAFVQLHTLSDKLLAIKHWNDQPWHITSITLWKSTLKLPRKHPLPTGCILGKRAASKQPAQYDDSTACDSVLGPASLPAGQSYQKIELCHIPTAASDHAASSRGRAEAQQVCSICHFRSIEHRAMVHNEITIVGAGVWLTLQVPPDLYCTFFPKGWSHILISHLFPIKSPFKKRITEALSWKQQRPKLPFKNNLEEFWAVFPQATAICFQQSRNRQHWWLKRISKRLFLYVYGDSLYTTEGWQDSFVFLSPFPCLSNIPACSSLLTSPLMVHIVLLPLPFGTNL